MSSTNKTTNYELSQFIGSDKPAWLADYNQDMSKIDTQMKANADGVTAATGKADANTSNIGELTYLSTTAKNNLVAAINEVDSDVATAQNTANSANTTAGSAMLGVNALKAQFNFSNIKIYSQSTPNNWTFSNATFTAGFISIAANADSTLFKCYGDVVITNMTAGREVTITLPTTGIAVDESYSISPFGIYQAINGGLLHTVYGTINNNEIKITFTPDTSGIAHIWIQPCIYLNSDFGDITD